MPNERDRVVKIVGAILVVLAQIIVAPNIAISSIMPNFILVYVLVVAIQRPQTCGYVLPFTLGLIYDLLGTGPVGAMAFLCVLMTFLSSRAFLVLNNDTLFMPLATLSFSTLVTEMLYGIFLISASMDVSVIDALVYRGLPCTLYDGVAGLVVYIIAMRFFINQTPQHPGITQLR